MNWQRSDNYFKVEVEFKNQTELMNFTYKIAVESDRMNHHADMEICYNKLKLTVQTHDVNSITEKDHLLITAINEIYNNL
jgi:4a-hydroxytetrahydrobiopterin dehydratase